MKKLAVLSAVALIGAGVFTAADAEARYRRGNGGAVAAGIIGGLAAGALIGAAASNAYAAPAYDYGYAPTGYGYGYSAPRVVRSYEYAPAYYVPRRTYRTRVVETYDYVPTYRTRRVVRSYDYAPADYGW
jgi:hypothetical protein